MNFLNIFATSHQLGEFSYEKSSLQLSTIMASHLHLIDLFESGSSVMASLLIFAFQIRSSADVFFIHVQVSSTEISISSFLYIVIAIFTGLPGEEPCSMALLMSSSAMS